MIRQGGAVRNCVGMTMLACTPTRIVRGYRSRYARVAPRGSDLEPGQWHKLGPKGTFGKIFHHCTSTPSPCNERRTCRVYVHEPRITVQPASFTTSSLEKPSQMMA